MRLLDWILGRRADPTRGWPVVPGPAPDLNWSFMQFGSLRFGDPVDAALFLGHPDGFRRHKGRDNYGLFYARKGFGLGFEGGRFVELTFYVGPKSHSHAAFSPAQPKAPDGTRLTPEADRNRIVALFGEPDPRGSDDTLLDISHGRVISNFFLDEQGRLERWELFLND
jgi:hypothetical protein